MLISGGASTLSLGDFKRIKGLVGGISGIKLPPAKRSMVQARLLKRLRALGIPSLGEYCSYLFSDDGMRDELEFAVNVITTNKTDFFREPAHFEFLSKTALPELAAIYGHGKSRPLRVWSAACSTGMEPYTLAMVLSEFRREHAGFKFTILATDLSTDVLQKGRDGIYEMERMEPVSYEMRRRYLLRSKDREKNIVRVKPSLRSTVIFQQSNLMDDTYDIPQQMDLIFLRNVLIYFDKTRQKAILEKICKHLSPEGYLFVGFSETLSRMDLQLKMVSPTIYRRKEPSGS